jgi:hypothetical protein
VTVGMFVLGVDGHLEIREPVFAATQSVDELEAGEVGLHFLLVIEPILAEPVELEF